MIALPGNPAKEEELDCGTFCYDVKENPVQKVELQVLCFHCPVLFRALHHQLPPPCFQAVARQEVARGISGSKSTCPKEQVRQVSSQGSGQLQVTTPCFSSW